MQQPAWLDPLLEQGVSEHRFNMQRCETRAAATGPTASLWKERGLRGQGNNNHE